jgi:SagB-type dehydrogenase family enzyme
MSASDRMIHGDLPEDDAMSLSLLFHLNSEPWLNSAAYATAGQSGTPLDLGTAPRVALPVAGKSGLAALLRTRRSCRSFARRTMPLPTLADLLDAAAGVTERVVLEDGNAFLRRGAPSAGGLFPLDVYVFTQAVDQLPDGIHRYDQLAHSLVEIARADPATMLARALYAHPFASDANLVITFVARFERTQTKYGPRGYRYILLEAGHCAQDICLRAAELELGTLCMGGYLDGEINRTLALEPTEAGVVYMVAAGYPVGE